MLAVGDRAVLSHRDATALHGLGPSNGTRVDVSTSDRNRSSLPGVTVHSSLLVEADVTVVNAIPTTAARTLVDLAGVVPRDQLARALTEAERMGVLDVEAIEAARSRARGRRGRGDAALQAAIAEHRALRAQLTRSKLEARFLELLRSAGLPRPSINATIHGHEVDALWPERRVIVELDGWAFHHTRRAFRRDRSKANALMLRGYAVLRSTHDDVTRRPERVAAELRGLLTT